MNLFEKLDTLTFGKQTSCYWNSGDATAQGAETASSNFMNTLQQAYGQQYATQQNTLNFLNSKMTSTMNNPQGYQPGTLAAMRTSATDQIAQQFQSAKMANQNSQFSRGSENNPSGVNAQINASLTSQAAQTEAGAQNQITQQNANLQQQNYWNASNALMGVSAQYNPTGYAGSAEGAAGDVGSLSGAVTAAQGLGFGAIAGGAASGIISHWTGAGSGQGGGGGGGGGSMADYSDEG
jgi:hypothetical protein